MSARDSKGTPSSVGVNGGKPVNNVLRTLFEKTNDVTTRQVGQNEIDVCDKSGGKIFHVTQTNPTTTSYTDFNVDKVPQSMNNAIKDQCRGKPNAKVRITGSPDQIIKTIQQLGVDKVKYTDDTIANLGKFKATYDSLVANSPATQPQQDSTLNVSITSMGGRK